MHCAAGRAPEEVTQEQRFVLRGTAIGAAVAASFFLVRPRYLSWAATGQETEEPHADKIGRRSPDTGRGSGA